MRNLFPILYATTSLCWACSGSDKPIAATEMPIAASEVPIQQPAENDLASLSGEVKTLHFDSAALGVSKAYWLYLPAGYTSSDKRYPVIYMLHGLGGSENNWVKHMKLSQVADEIHLQAIVVMPDGDNSFYMNSSTEADYEECLKTPRVFGKNDDLSRDCVQSAKYEDYIASDLVSHVDSTFRTIATRNTRAIGGLSMGGYGALMLAMRHKDVFSSVASHSGVDALLYTGPYPYQKGKSTFADDPAKLTGRMGAFGDLFLSIFGTQIENWRAHDPAVLAESLSDGELSIYIDCGTEDEFRLQHGASYLHEVLVSRGIEHFFTLTKGQHNLLFWADRIDDSLRFHSAHFAKMSAQ